MQSQCRIITAFLRFLAETFIEAHRARNFNRGSVLQFLRFLAETFIEAVKPDAHPTKSTISSLSSGDLH